MRNFKIATWNVNSLRVRLSHVLQWLEAEKPDVLALQELKMPTTDFFFEEIRAAGYEAFVNGQKTYNGVAILSRLPATEIVTDFPTFEDSQRRILGITIGETRILNLYVPNGESVTSEKYSYKLNWLEHLQQFLQKELQKYPRMVVVGDFNIAPHDDDVHDPAAFAGGILCSEPERNALKGIFELGFNDCFRMLNQTEKSFSWWDYRMNAFKRNLGARIDHILASGPLAQICKSCQIDRTPRGWERPSDHTPVFAHFSA